MGRLSWTRVASTIFRSDGAITHRSYNIDRGGHLFGGRGYCSPGDLCSHIGKGSRARDPGADLPLGPRRSSPDQILGVYGRYSEFAQV